MCGKSKDRRFGKPSSGRRSTSPRLCTPRARRYSENRGWAQNALRFSRSTPGGKNLAVMRSSIDHPKRFSMIRGFTLADFFTLANVAFGMAAVFCAMTYLSSQSLARFFLVTALAPAALVFDVFDGRVARRRHTHSALGRELDSLADVISFGVVPAAIGFAAGL